MRNLLLLAAMVAVGAMFWALAGRASPRDVDGAGSKRGRALWPDGTKRPVPIERSAEPGGVVRDQDEQQFKKDGRGGKEKPAVRVGYTIREKGELALAHFTHLVSGETIPLDVREYAGLSAGDSEKIEKAGREELDDITGTLRAFAKELPDFGHSEEDCAGASAADLMTWVAQYQPMHLEMAPVLQHMDEPTWRQLVEERRPWTQWFKEGGLVMRYTRLMHDVRRRTIRRIEKSGVDVVALDKLRQRYLLDGHFRPGKDLPFEFGRDPGRQGPARSK